MSLKKADQHMLYISSRPLSARIFATPSRSKVKVPNMESFDGFYNPQEHIEHEVVFNTTTRKKMPLIGELLQDLHRVGRA